MALLLANAPSQATAAPGTPKSVSPDPEGGSPSLSAALENASRGYTTAKAKLELSRKKQSLLTQQLRITETKVATLTKDVNVLAAGAYRGSGTSVLMASVDSDSLTTVLHKSAFLEQLAWQDARKLDALRASRKELDSQRKKIDAEILVQQAQQNAMAKRKLDAERALGLVGGGRADVPVGNSRAARSAPRRPDGSWPGEGCSRDDPTSGGCLTPRMYHAYLEARAAGFQRYTHCYRSASYGEHGKGRACDFAAASSGFGGAATGANKAYGDRLAAFFVANADQLAVLYVIWYRRIWMPGTGWRAYSGGGSPSAAHTNHVHLSVL
jgi:hypothetical protein